MTEVPYASLEIGLSSLGGNLSRVEVRYWPLNSDVLEPAATGEARLDPDEFTGLLADDYGRLLTERLFASRAVRERFLLAQQDTYARNKNPSGLRVRMWFNPGAEHLYDLSWELLCDPPRDDAPGTQAPLSTQDLVPFSRFLGGGNRTVLLRPKGELRVLVIIANPEVLECHDDGTRALAKVDVNAEWDRARTALLGLQAPTLLANHAAAAGPPTRNRLLHELADTSYDIVYIVCHGALDLDCPFLLLETDQGQADSTPGSVLVETLQGLPQPPRLAVLTACQSAGTSRSTDNKAHLALGPKLVRAGVPAVLAMNGKVTQLTAAEFYTRFFGELKKHGSVDRAMTTARRTVKNLARPDWWMPVLYMRLTAGRIWSVLHLIARDNEPYEELSSHLQHAICTPIVGPALLESLWGSPRIVARDWAERRGFPLSPYRTEELPTVAQFLARRRGGRNRMFVVGAWLQAMEASLNKKWPGLSAHVGGLDGVPPAQRVAQLASAAGVRLRQDPLDPHYLLARLPVSIYLTATPDPLLADALRAAAPPRRPIVEYARWTNALERKPRAFDESDKHLVFTRDQPLVYHLFGTLDESDSLVLTEDDFFDYLIHVVKDTSNTAIPNLVRTAWSQNALMLLGFDLDDWTFRVLYRAIVEEPGHLLRLRQGPLSAAVQLNPEEDRNLQPELALQHLEQVFGSEQISLSWSQPKDFLCEVWKLLPPAFGGPA